jgi:hypothetical protein
MSVDSGSGQALVEIQDNWVALHVFYHESLDLLLRDFVHPAVVSLIKTSRVKAFFFVRYGLGGPHIRLRLRVRPKFRDRVLTDIQNFAQNFLFQFPSTKSLEYDSIHRINEIILASDPNEVDASAYPDNSFHIAPFSPEVQRYGGSKYFQSSLDFFTLSSIVGIEFVSKCRYLQRSAQLAYAFRLLLQQAAGFAIDKVELFDLLGYGVDSLGAGRQKVIDKGDKVALSKMDSFLQLSRESLGEVRALSIENKYLVRASEFLIIGAGRLSAALGTTDRMTRMRIAGSHLHMTATRLGLSNAEEVYLSRILTLTLREMHATSEESLSWLKEKMVHQLIEAPGALGDLLAPALEILAENSMNQQPLLSSR